MAGHLVFCHLDAPRVRVYRSLAPSSRSDPAGKPTGAPWESCKATGRTWSYGREGQLAVRAGRRKSLGPFLYAVRAMPGRVLMVIDTQEGFTRQGNLASETCTAAIPRIRSIVEEERAAGTPVIF